MGLILVRYGEIGLKGQNRTYFFRKLRNNIRQCLKANSLEGEVWQEGQRVYLRTDQVDTAINAVQRVFGIVSLSPVREIAPEIEAITKEAVEAAKRAGLDSSRSFRVKARRSDKSFPLISPQLERHAAEAIAEATNGIVDLSKNADVEIGVEVQQHRALVFGDTVDGYGGMPVGSQGRVIALMSSGIDSPVAAWLMMKRGCSVIPLHFSVSEQQAAQVRSIVEVLNQYAYGWHLKPIILSHEEVLGPSLARLRQVRQERWTCLFCKRAMLSKAAEIAEEMGAGALVTGDSLGQVASQTLSNMEVISYGISKPILRPLIGLDKVEIIDIARRIGTFEPSIDHSTSCPFLPNRPLTQSTVQKLQALLEEMKDFGSAGPVPGPAGETRLGSYV